MEDFYQILGISNNASQDEIKKAFHRLAKQYHPDIIGTNTADADYFKKITESYQILSDPDQRRHYDIKRIVRITTSSPKTQVKEVVNYAFQGVSDFLNELLFKDTNFVIKQDPVQGEDVETKISISFEESYLGCKKNIFVKIPRICSSCKGKGWPPKHPPQTCPECKGAKIRLSKGTIPFKRTCKRCGGKGLIKTHICQRCQGNLLCLEKESILIEIPAGVDNKTRLCLAKKGGSGLYKGERGDLFVQVQVESKLGFTRNEQDLYFTIPICFSELILGVELPVLLPGEKLNLKVPAGTDLKKSFRIKGKGFASPDSNQRGDLYINLQLVLPAHIPDSALPLFKQLANIIDGF